MNPASGASVEAPSQKIVLPLVCTAAWAVAAAGARLLGIWTAVGATAIALGITVLVLDGAAARKILAPRPRLVLLGAGVGATMAAATYLLYPLFSAAAPFVAKDTAVLYSAFRAPSLPAVLLAFLPVIFGEELIWRGIRLQKLPNFDPATSVFVPSDPTSCRRLGATTVTCPLVCRCTTEEAASVALPAPHCPGSQPARPRLRSATSACAGEQ